MNKAARIFGIVFFSCWAFSSAYVAATLSDELINRATAYAGASVVYQGELIGSVLDRGPFVWLNIHDGGAAIGVWVQKTRLPEVRFGGMHGVRGDILRVTGVFHRSCAEHGGVLDIHAQEMELLIPGRVLPGAVSLSRVKALGLLSGAVICLWIARIWRRRRSRM